MKTNTKSILAVAIATAAISAAPAAFAHSFFAPVPSSIQSAYGGLTLEAGQLHQNYSETRADGSVADKESGSIAHYGVSAGWQTGHIGGTVGLSADTGKTTYTGATQGGAPLDTKTKNTMINVSFALRYGFSPVARIAVMPEVMYQGHVWGRRTLSAAPYTETYGNGVIAGGLVLAYAVTPQVVVSVEGLSGRAFGSFMKTNMGGAINGTNLYRLGSKPWSRVGATVNWQFSKHVGLFATVTETQFKYGASAKHTDQTSGGTLTTWEPDSKTVQQVAALGVRVHF